MEIHGHVQNGLVVLDGDVRLPEGAEVVVICPAINASPASSTKRRAELPVVRSDRPGSINLTAAQVAELLEADDLPPGR